MASTKTARPHALHFGVCVLAFVLACNIGVARAADAQNTDPGQLAGTYHDTYSALIADKSEI